MNNSNTLNENNLNFENNLNLLKNAINAEDLKFEISSVDIDSGDRLSANAVPNKLNSSESVVIKSHWWGIDIILSEKLTKDIINGTEATGSLAQALAAAFGFAGVFTGGAATLIGAGLAAAFSLKAAELKIADNGKGVHFPITWPQWGTVLAGLTAGVAGVTAALLIFIHPLRNK